MESEQTQIDPFRELNRYDHRDEDWPSSEVFEAPRRTLANGWRKFHADRDCGSSSVHFVEERSHKSVSEKYAYNLVCWSCGHEVPETEVLFIGGQWFTENGWKTYGRPIEDLDLPEDRVLALGPNPDQDELRDALEVTRIEREASFPNSFWLRVDRRWKACEECRHAVPVRFDDHCRMCYDGEWTERMTKTLTAMGRAIREANQSFEHRLPTQLDPCEPGAAPAIEAILWRRHDAENTAKLVEVTQRLEDQDDGHMEYVLQDPTHTQRWQYREDDLRYCFWATGLYNDEHAKPVQDERIREIYQRVCDHSFSEIHDRETLEPVGEECLHCRKRRESKE